MIKCPKGMRLNKFQQAKLPSIRDMFSRFGPRVKAANSSDEVAEFDRNPARRLSQFDEEGYQAYSELMNKERAEREKQQREQQKEQQKED